MRLSTAALISYLFVALLAVGPVHATFTITLDFSHDDVSSNPFWSGGTEGALRRSALQAAVDDINSLLAYNSLADITTDPVTTVTGSTSVTFDALVQYTNPDTGAPVQITDLTTLAADEFRLFVGGRDLSTAGGLGSDNTLAQGGRAGTAAGFISGNGQQSQWVAAVAAGEAAFNAQFGRGPIMDTFAGTTTLGSTPASWEVEMGVTVGQLWFDTDTNNDQVTDTEALWNSEWHSNHLTDPAVGETDIYTVALHEILHAIGFSNSNDAFSGNVGGDGNDWTGPAVVAILGGGDNNALHPTSTAHLNSATSSFVLGTATAQDAVMEPTLGSGPGSRRFITELDAAILSDMGYTLVPEVSSFVILAPLMAFVVLGHRRRPRRA